VYDYLQNNLAYCLKALFTHKKCFIFLVWSELKKLQTKTKTKTKTRQ